MPRTARIQSQTQIYHIILRGINRQDIFFDEEDRLKYLGILREYKAVCGFELYSYCLMDNHIHLLLKVGDEPLETVVKRISCKFVYWYNLKYQRTGPLYQGRFRSEPVEDDAYFLTVLRYILQNPVKARISAKPESYRWSSYSCYNGWPDGLTDTAFAMGMFSGRSALLSFLNEKNNDSVLDISPAQSTGLTDEEAASVMAAVCGCGDASAFQQLPRAKQTDALRHLSGRGLSLRQISRLTGWSTTSALRSLHGE